jgi:hypothetical protein
VGLSATDEKQSTRVSASRRSVSKRAQLRWVCAAGRVYPCLGRAPTLAFIRTRLLALSLSRQARQLAALSKIPAPQNSEEPSPSPSINRPPIHLYLSVGPICPRSGRGREDMFPGGDSTGARICICLRPLPAVDPLPRYHLSSFLIGPTVPSLALRLPIGHSLNVREFANSTALTLSCHGPFDHVSTAQLSTEPTLSILHGMY